MDSSPRLRTYTGSSLKQPPGPLQRTGRSTKLLSFRQRFSDVRNTMPTVTFMDKVTSKVRTGTKRILISMMTTVGLQYPRQMSEAVVASCRPLHHQSHSIL